jgi:3-hydroxyisobutyrate dehydrogenase-like beta-hydroxyacid dehydrogenase
MQIAFLGLGQMGLAIAKLLVEKGHSVTVWNRTAAAANPLVDRGATLAETPVQAVRAADVVFTMLFDDHAVEDVLFNHKALEAIPANAIHISLSTISVALAQRLEVEHEAHKQRFLSMPVFGRPAVAAEGKLWLVIAGASDVIAEVKPLLEAFSRGNTVVGTRPNQANAVKLCGNFLITSMIASLSEAFTVAESQGVDPAIFLETINSALFQSAFVGNYGKIMIAPPATPGATMKLGAKDTKLFREAAQPGKTPTPLADLYQHQFEAAIEAGRGDEDWAAGYLSQTRAQINDSWDLGFASRHR